MNKIFAMIIAFGLFSVLCRGQKQSFSSAALSEKVIALEGSLISFDEVLKKHAGKTILIDIWASWCKDCVKAVPKTLELHAANPDVSFVYISMDKAVNKWVEAIEKHKLVGDHYMATDGMKGVFGKSIDLDWIPRYIIIDITGKIALYRAVETDFEKMEETLKKHK